MKCYQCDRAAMYLIGEKQNIPLCLYCYEKVNHQSNIDFIKSAIMMNTALDDMDAISGIYTPGGRIAVESMMKVMSKNQTYNNISISNSQVGMINTGDLAKIDAAITLTKSSDSENIGNQIQLLTQQIIDTKNLNEKSKNDLIDLLQCLSEQVLSGRKQSVMESLAAAIKNNVGALPNLIISADKLIELIKQITI